ncbi:pilus assembly protein PilM [Vibrio tritonius]|uniref:pilus assembly protein PilM n=1 Tax=Vibrio tritonius TaxID=1435069 RepID=UPI000838B0E4|nr:pilus assembly protein PilM [Vibrio tritonius]
MGISSRVTGVDIGHHSIKAVTLTKWRNTDSVIFYAELLVPDGIFADNHMLNYQKIVKKLKELKKGLPLFSRKVAIAIPDSAVITKQLQLDSYQPPEMALKNLLCEQVPFLADDLAFDYTSAADSAGSSELGPTYQVYAARLSLLEHRIALLRSSGFDPFFISPQGHSLLAIWSRLSAITQNDNWMLLDIGHSKVTLCRGGDIPWGKVIDIKSVAPNEFVSESNWMLALVQQLHLYQSLSSTVPIKGVWLTGGGALNGNIESQLQQCLKLPCEIVNLDSLLVAKNKEAVSLPSQFSCALGLAFNGLNWKEGRNASSS